MATHLGDLGRARGPVDLTFGWFGATIRVAPNAGDLALVDFLEKAKELDEGDEVGGLAITMDFLREQVDQRDFSEFVRLARANGQRMLDLLAVAKTICALVTLFPTGLPSGSSDGQQTTGQRSTDGSSSAATSPVAGAVTRTMQRLNGRPDLKMIVYLAETARREKDQAAA